MDFNSVAEFPPASQVMSPSDATASTYDAARGASVTDVQLAAQIRALTAGEAATSDSRATRRRRCEEESPRTPFAQGRGAAQQTSGADATSAKLPGGKDRVVLLPLDVGKPEAYENWRRSAQAAVACRAGVDPVAMEYLAEIDNPHRADAQLADAAQQVTALRILDMLLYTAILHCIEGSRRETVLNRIHAAAAFGQGGLALRCLDKIFQRSSVRQRAAATAELLQLAPRGSRAADVDDFLARYRALLSRTGTDVGPAVQADILQRAAAGHPVLGAVAAAWKHGDGEDAGLLLERLEAAAAEGLYAGQASGQARAWAALDAAPHTDPSTVRQQRGWGPAERDEWAAAAAAQTRMPTTDPASGPVCWTCNKRGYVKRQCPHGRQQHGAGGQAAGSGSSGNGAIMAKLNELIDLMKQSKK